MGFSVIAAHVIFALALLGAGSVALGSYWSTQDAIEEARRVHAERIIQAAHTNLTFVGPPQWAPSSSTVTFTIKNTGSVGLQYGSFTYLFDGRMEGTMAANYPRLNGDPTVVSALLLPGDTLELKFTGLTGNPSKIHVVANNAITTHYP